MYYCIGYTSNNDWSTSEIPLDQYQEKLLERWDKLIMYLKQQLKEREEELQEEKRMKLQERRKWEESQQVQKEIKHQLQEKVMDYTRCERTITKQYQ